MHLSLHTISVAGLALIALALAVYLVTAIAAILRVHRQYNAAITGMAGLYTGTLLAAWARLWPVLIVGAVGVLLLLVSR